MSARTARAIAIAICVISLASVIVSVPLQIRSSERIEPGQIVVVGDPTTARTQETLRELRADHAAGDPLTETTGGFSVWTVIVLLALFGWLAVGTLIVSRQPTNWAGWLFLITGSPLPLLAVAQQLVIHAVKVDPGSVPALDALAFYGEYGIYPMAVVPLLFLLYPDGHPPSRRWRWAVAGLVGGTVFAVLGFLFRPGPFNAYLGDGILYVNPIGIDALAEIGSAMITIGAVIALVSAFSTVIAVRQRFKRSRGDERQQMRWLAYVASLAGAFFVLQWILGFIGELFAPDPNAPVFNILFALTAFTVVLGVPLAYVVAILRHGLWDLDVVVKKTVQYGVLVALFTLLAVVVVALVPVLFVGAGTDFDVVPILIAAGVLAIGFQLIRGRTQRWANRIVYGRRSTPYEVLSAFSERVGETYSTEDVLPRMAQLLGEATGARVARVWLRIGTVMRAEASWPDGADVAREVEVNGEELPAFGGDRAFEVRHQAELLGALTVTEAPDDPMTPSKERLVRDMAAQAGLVLRNVRLIEDLRESRRRIVAAQDARAKKLERDIHDGAQQQLVALQVKQRLTDSMVDRDPAKAHELLRQLQADTAATLDDLRDLARGIYPPLLADEGLAAALGSQARRSPVPVEVQPDGIGRYSQEIESAVYFSCLEALQNVAKYAEASTVTVRLAQANGSLTFEVSDDGIGFDPVIAGRGSGLQGIADRLAALGGEVTIRSAPGDGTTVAGRLPVQELLP